MQIPVHTEQNEKDWELSRNYEWNWCRPWKKDTETWMIQMPFIFMSGKVELPGQTSQEL